MFIGHGCHHDATIALRSMKFCFRGLLALHLSVIALIAQTGDATQPAPLKIGSVTFSGSIRERVEFWDWFAGTGQNNYAFSGTLTQFAFSQNSKAFEWNVNFAIPALLGLPDGAAVPPPQGQLGLGGTYYVNNDNQRFTAFVFPKQAYIRFKGEHGNVQLGRFEFGDGAEGKPKSGTLTALKNTRISQRLLGISPYAIVERSFDGVHATYTKGDWTFTGVGAIPTRGLFQVDGWGWVTTPFAYVAATREVAYSSHNSAEWRLFGIYYNDPRQILKTDNRPASARTLDRFNAIHLGTYGGHYIQAIESRAGTFDLLAWGALQSGSWGGLSQHAAAAALETGIQPKFWKTVRPWIRGGYFYASGDGDSQDGTHGTFLPLLYSARAYSRFPFFSQLNNRDAFGELILRPSRSVTIRTDGHYISLASKNDLWYSGSGAYQPWTFGYQGRPSNGKSKLANLYDVSLDYAFNKAASIGFYYGYAQGGDVIQAIYKNANGNLGFVELNYKF